MTTDLYLAPAAGGKTEYALDLARAAAREGVAVRVVVPVPQQVAAFRRRLARRGGALGVHVFTFNALVDAVLARTGTEYTKLDEPVKQRLLRLLAGESALSHYDAIRDKPGFLQLLGDLIADLKGELIFPDELAAELARQGAGARLAELAALYDAYQDTLRERAWADSAGMQWLALEALQDETAVPLGWPLLIIDGFDDFSRAQLALLAALQGRVGRLVVTLTETGDGRFPRYARTHREVAQALGVDGRPLPAAAPPAAPLPALAAALFTPQDAPAPPPEQTAVRLLEAPDQAAEVRAALRWLKERIVRDGLAVDEVALLARDFTPYQAHARQIAAEFGLPLHLVGGLPLLHSPVIAALQELLALHLPLAGRDEPQLPRRGVVSTWRSPYFDWPGGELAPTAADADALDALARRQRVIRGLSQWQEAFAAQLAAAGPGAEDDDEDDFAPGPVTAGAAAGALQARFTHFLALTAPPPAAPLAAYVAWLDGLIGPDPAAQGEAEAAAQSLGVVACARRPGGDTAADLAALQALKGILRGLLWADEAVGDGAPLRYAAFYQELWGAVSGAVWEPDEVPAGGAILAGSVVRLRGLPFRAAAVLGLSEGLFPAAVLEDPFLRDADRDRLRDGLGARLLSSTRSEEREFFYQAMTRPAQAVLLTRPVLADNGATWVASPFWEEVARRAGVQAQRPAGETAVPPQQAASAAEWWESVADQPQMPCPAELPDARPQVARGAAVWAARQARALGAWQGDLRGAAGLLDAAFGPDAFFSASRLEAYQSCNFSFFTRYVLGLAPREEPREGLDAAQLGSVYHQIFAAVYGDTAAPRPAGADAAALEEWVRGVAAPLLEAAPRRFGFRATPWWGQTGEEIIAGVVASLLALEAADFAFVQAEAAFGYDGAPPLALDDGAVRLRLRGFIDRVDRAPDGRIRIIDYKLGGKDKYKPQAFTEGRRLQLPLYALAAQEALGLGEIADGFYWHYRQGEASRFTLAGADGGARGAIDTAVAHALSAAANIRAGHFAPEVPEEGCPSYCPAAAFCHHYRPAYF